MRTNSRKQITEVALTYAYARQFTKITSSFGQLRRALKNVGLEMVIVQGKTERFPSAITTITFPHDQC